MKTLADCEAAMRECARALPPSDFGSTRAIQAAARVLLAAVQDARSEGRMMGPVTETERDWS